MRHKHNLLGFLNPRMLGCKPRAGTGLQPTFDPQLNKLYSLLNLLSFLLAYHFLPEGFRRGSPYSAVGSFVASASSFGSEFSLTLLFNLGMGLGGIEMLAYVLVISATANIGLYDHDRLTQWQEENCKKSG